MAFNEWKLKKWLNSYNIFLALEIKMLVDFLSGTHLLNLNSFKDHSVYYLLILLIFMARSTCRSWLLLLDVKKLRWRNMRLSRQRRYKEHLKIKWPEFGWINWLISFNMQKLHVHKILTTAPIYKNIIMNLTYFQYLRYMNLINSDC